ncbi:uncharacterized protein LOC111906219 [Lactuca sativa]|uniref:uncharacterized protein LOC111906219 n=1 Tax=Lactuca sativa TaxID=4236 RepID=UPI000CD8976C|nr:uncharacterized protein LOC111906219 [Lactuca sativa]
MSKVDRIIICPSFPRGFHSAYVVSLLHEYFDHLPIILRSLILDFGPLPFRFFNSWLLQDDIEVLIKKFVSSYVSKGGGKADLNFMEKLIDLKNDLKAWRLKETHIQKEELLMLKNKVDDLDKLADHKPLSDHENNERTGHQKILDMETIIKLDLKQKNWIKWLVDDDKNTIFFHGVINNKNRKIKINELLINAEWVTEVNRLKLQTWSFFNLKFIECFPDRLKLINHNFKKISLEDCIFLEQDFELIEVKSSI